MFGLMGVARMSGQPGGDAFSPLSLFAAGELGAWYDPSDFASMFQDSAGTTPVTAVGQPVGRINDKSGNGNHATQATAAARPVVSARKNFLTYTEDLTNGGASIPPWYRRTDVTVTANQGAGAFADLDLVNNPVSGGAYTGVYAVSSIAAANSTVTAQVVLASVSGTTTARISLSPFSGGVAEVVSTVSLTTTPTVFTLTGSFGAGAVGNAYFELSQGTANVPILAGRVQIEHGATATTYQRVTTASDYDTAGFPHYIANDGIDDELVTTFPDLGTDVTIARAVPMVGASILTGQTIGAGTWTDSTNHAGLVIIDRALTAGETTALTAYLNEKAGV